MSSRDLDDTDLPEYYRAKMREPHPPGTRERPRRAPEALPGYYHTGTIPPDPRKTPRKASERYRSDRATA